MKTLYEVLIKQNLKKIAFDKYICMGYDNNFHMLNGHFCDFWHCLDTDENTKNPTAFLLSKEEIKKYIKYIDDIYLVPNEYDMQVIPGTDRIKDQKELYRIQDDWMEDRIKSDKLTKINIDDIE